MKKILAKVIIFCAIFSAIFGVTQRVLDYPWTGGNDLYTRNVLYANEPENSIDVLFFGTSEIREGVSPIVLYHEQGITGWNLAVPMKSAITTYYQVEYALKQQTPKIVACDFEALFDDSLPSLSYEEEMLYHGVVEATPDLSIKNSLIQTICEEDPTQTSLKYYFPLLRYHSTWNELTVDNFLRQDHTVDEDYPSYAKGTTFVPNAYYNEDGIYELTDDLFSPEGEELLNLSEVSVKYYDKMIDLCHENGVTVVALLPPKPSSAAKKAANWEEMEEYFESRGVVVIDYKNYEEIKRVGLSLVDDYYDLSHLNYKGTVKWSKDLAVKLKEVAELPDRREDELSADWDDAWDDFIQFYDTMD